MLNIKILKEYQKKFEEGARAELYDDLRKEIIEFGNSEFYSTSFHKTKSRKKTIQSSRVLNNWINEGLLDETKEEGIKGRTFSRIESIWLNAVSILREFGMPLETIKRVRVTLFKKKVGNKYFSAFDFAVMYSLLQEPLALLVFPNGHINLCSVKQYSNQVLNMSLEPHIYLNMLQIAHSEFPDNNFNTTEIDIKQKLSDKEIQLLYFLRTGDYNSIKVRMKDGVVYLIEGEKKIDKNKRVIDLIKENQYQDIAIKTEGGKIVQFNSTEKIRL